MGWWARAPAVLAAAAVLWLIAAAATGNADAGDLERAFPIVEPDYGHTKLRLAKEGLEAIRRIKTPIAAVSVIGPYRSGKSFLLNQLLSLSCDKGFGVGHMRDTKTKGIWVWGTPVELDIDGSIVSVLYLDTEGFESVGKSNVYDDRIFALATVLSSVLVYNLPETGQDVAFEPAKLLWLIQRDFLQGKSVQQMVDEALQRVPNNNGDKYIDEINQIRDSLAVMGDNSTAFSLPQPHLRRTQLCDLEDQELDPLYLERRDQLKQIVSSMIKPKVVQGRTLNGTEFVSFLGQILEALNKGEIPSTGSLVEVFNKAILERCLKVYHERMGRVGLPVSVDKLQQYHDLGKDEARRLFDKQHFGKHHAAQSIFKLDEEIKKMLARSRALFIKEYNNKLFNWLVIFSLVMVVIGRFVVKFFLLEIAAWVMFAFLETYTRLFWSSESLYYNPVWHIVVSTWETIVYSPVIDLDRWAIPILVVLSFLAIYWRCLGGRKGIARSLLPLYNGCYRNSNRPRTD
nr:unnamed protein product [Digitaria exilis]